MFKMKSSVELLSTCKNVVPFGVTEVADGLELPTLSLVEPSVEEWNRKAEIQNTKMFIQLQRRIPNNYGEVLKWIYSFVEPQYIPEQHKEAVSI